MEPVKEGGRLVLPLVYVAGPFAGPTNYDVQQNVARAEAIGLHIASLGAMAVIPHTMNRNFFGQKNETFWLAGVIELMRRCDATVFIKGWDQSKGAMAERDVVEELEQPCFFAEHDGWDDILRDWIHAWQLRRALLK